MKKKSNPYSPEVRERAVRMVLEHRQERPSQWAAIHPAGRSRSCVLSRQPRVRPGGVTQTNEPPEFRGRFTCA